MKRKTSKAIDDLDADNGHVDLAKAGDAALKEHATAVRKSMKKTTAKKSHVKGTVHAHWLWLRVDGLDKVSSAISMCEVEELDPQRGQVTADLKKVNCEECLKRVERTKARRVKPQPVAAALIAAAAKPLATVMAEAKKKIAIGNGSSKSKDAWPWPAGARLHLLTKQNPCKAGTAKAKRWAKVLANKGKTWEEHRDDEGNPETLRNAVRDKVVEIKGETE